MMRTFLALSVSARWSPSVGPWTASDGTTRAKPLYLPPDRAVAVADGDTYASWARSKTGPTASTSWEPAGPTIAFTALLETSCWATVEAWPGSSWVSPSSRANFVPFSWLNRVTEYFAQLSCSWPIDAASPVIGAITPNV